MSPEWGATTPVLELKTMATSSVENAQTILVNELYQ